MNELQAFSSPKVYALITQLFLFSLYYILTVGTFEFELAQMPQSVHLFSPGASNKALEVAALPQTCRNEPSAAPK